MVFGSVKGELIVYVMVIFVYEANFLFYLHSFFHFAVGLRSDRWLHLGWIIEHDQLSYAPSHLENESSYHMTFQCFFVCPRFLRESLNPIKWYHYWVATDIYRLIVLEVRGWDQDISRVGSFWWPWGRICSMPPS